VGGLKSDFKDFSDYFVVRQRQKEKERERERERRKKNWNKRKRRSDRETMH
jgi:uncharacterized LabA/DUF88 family protein